MTFSEGEEIWICSYNRNPLSAGQRVKYSPTRYFWDRCHIIFSWCPDCMRACTNVCIYLICLRAYVCGTSSSPRNTQSFLVCIQHAVQRCVREIRISQCIRKTCYSLYTVNIFQVIVPWCLTTYCVRLMMSIFLSLFPSLIFFIHERVFARPVSSQFEEYINLILLTNNLKKRLIYDTYRYIWSTNSEIDRLPLTFIGSRRDRSTLYYWCC